MASQRGSGRRTYSEETKAAVMAALLQGQSVGEVAKEYEIPSGTIKSWRAKLKDSDQPVATLKKREAVGELLIEYVRENLVTLREQAKIFRDPEWVREQHAQDMAVLHGVLTDKTVRLLEALGGGRGEGRERADDQRAIEGP